MKRKIETLIYFTLLWFTLAILYVDPEQTVALFLQVLALGAPPIIWVYSHLSVASIAFVK